MGAPGQGRSARAVASAVAGSSAEQALPEQLERGSRRADGHLVGDGWVTESQTGWVYGGDDVEDGTAGRTRECSRELVGGISVQEMDNGTRQLRAGSTAVREFFRRSASPRRARREARPRKRVHCTDRSAGAFLRGLFGADGCVRVPRREGEPLRRSRQPQRGLLKDVQRLLSAFGVRGADLPVRIGASSPSPTRATTAHAEYTSRQGFDLRITGSDLERFAESIGFSTPRKQTALEALLAGTTRYATKPGVDARRPRGRRSGGRLQPHRAAPPFVHRRWRTLLRTAASTCASTTPRATSRRST